MKISSRLVLVASVLTMTACASVPTGPSVMVLPGQGKTFEQFHADDGACRQVAAREIQSTRSGEVPAQYRYDVAYMQCMYAKGHQIPGPGTRSSTETPSPSATAPGTPTAAPVSWPPKPEQLECEGSGGVWRAALDFCEFPEFRTRHRR